MNKNTAANDRRSLKTFFLYAAIVLFFIIISLAIKTFFIIQQSKFDGEHQFIVAIAKGKNVEEVISFNPAMPAVSLLQIKGKPVSLASFGKTFGFIPDATITAMSDMQLGSDVAKTMTAVAWRYNRLKTDITIFDIARLLFISKKAKNTIDEITLPADTVLLDKKMVTLFTDEAISAENVTIQIVNASDVSGLGKRLERVLTNRGGNVVSIATSHTPETSSKIQYFGKETYTLKKLGKLLQFPITQLEKETIANIVIVLGEDSQNTTKF